MRLEALYLASADEVKRRLVVAFFANDCVHDDGHQTTVVPQRQPAPSAIRDAAQARATRKGAGENSDASTETGPADIVLSSV
ncbi:hypothetical protein ACH61_00818 [Rathayibacter tanaceti]|uniref:Uncharacterized protein n=1 Tax=Rathayibacter tanaceti TaxID=1671680 RepID=A0A166IAB4_9MICO|nr:hypothetical protein ACH61_00818 [Rathayibacter tanaceti]